jgi:MarR family transcriptional regulator, organic hydroperoxide resistance regulator
MMRRMRQLRRKDTSEPDLDPVLDFLRLLWGIEHRLQSASKRMEAALGITGPQRLVLRVVARFPGLSAGDLAEVVRLHPSTVTGILQRLVQKNLLARDTDPDDSRRVRLHVRPAAKQFTQRSRGTVEAAVARALKQLPARDIAQARRVLAAVTGALEASHD